MVVVNNSDENQTVKTARFAENIKNFKSGKDVISEQTFNITNQINLEPKSVLILELN
jgi:hypothetical protein